MYSVTPRVNPLTRTLNEPEDQEGRSGWVGKRVESPWLLRRTSGWTHSWQDSLPLFLIMNIIYFVLFILFIMWIRWIRENIMNTNNMKTVWLSYHSFVHDHHQFPLFILFIMWIIWIREIYKHMNSPRSSLFEEVRKPLSGSHSDLSKR